MKYKELFTPIILAKQEIKNRIAMAPMGCTRESQYGDGSVSTELIDYFEARAKGGVGMIISPFTAVDKRYYTLTLGLFSREHVLGISRLAEALRVFECKFILQLSHFGGKSPKGFEYDRDPIAPSAIESIMYPEVPVEMSLDQIQETIECYIQCGIWAHEAGCAGVELHGAHGYLINQFISPHSNRREDEYGGTLEKRMNFVVKIARALRERCGEEFIIGFKYSAHEHLQGGIDIKIAKQIGEFVDKQGILDYIHISAYSTLLPGFLDCDYPSVPPMYTPHPLIPLAEEIKKAVNLPVIATGGITDPDYANGLIAEGKTDMVALGRTLIADPDWADKARKGGNIRHCLLCNTCYFRGMTQKTIKCSINPNVGEERRYQFYLYHKAEVPKKVLIVGAGPAGLETAISADKRGHTVTLVEKENSVGGMLRFGSIPEFKRNVGKLINYYENEIQKSSVYLKTGVEADANFILNEECEAIVLAIGGTPIIPVIEGIDNEFVFTAVQVFQNEKLLKGLEVSIIGAGYVGCELGLHLALKGKKVRVIDFLKYDNILTGDHPVNKSMLIRNMHKEKVELLTESRVLKIADNEITIADIYANKEKKIPAENVIIAAGYTPKKELELELQSKINLMDLPPELYSIGDCHDCEKIYNAVNSGANLAWRL